MSQGLMVNRTGDRLIYPGGAHLLFRQAGDPCCCPPTQCCANREPKLLAVHAAFTGLRQDHCCCAWYHIWYYKTHIPADIDLVVPAGDFWDDCKGGTHSEGPPWRDDLYDDRDCQEYLWSRSDKWWSIQFILGSKDGTQFESLGLSMSGALLGPENTQFWYERQGGEQTILRGLCRAATVMNEAYCLPLEGDRCLIPGQCTLTPVYG